MDGIRQLNANDLHEALALSEFAFQFQLSDEDRDEQLKNAKPEQSWGYFDQGRLAARLTILPLQIWLHGATFDMGGIAAVATWPEFRRQGMVRELLIHSMKIMREKGQTVSLLAPFSFPFYRKFGWELLTVRKTYSARIDDFPEFPAQPGHIDRSDSVTCLHSVYQQYARRYNGALCRNDEWWNGLFEKWRKQHANIAVYYDEHQQAKAYIVYAVRDQTMDIFEWVYLDQQSLKATAQFVQQHDSMVKKEVHWKAPSDDAFFMLAPNLNMSQQLKCYFMCRIVDVRPFLQAYPFTCPEQNLAFRIKVNDEYAPWNNGTFQVNISDTGQVDVKSFADGDVGKVGPNGHVSLDPGQTLSCDIQTLNMLLFGVQRAVDLMNTDRLHGSPSVARQLDQIIPRQLTYFMDIF